MINTRFITINNGDIFVYSFKVFSTHYEIIERSKVNIYQEEVDTVCKGYGCSSNRGKPFSFTFGYKNIVDTILCTDCQNDFLRENLI